jgi:hypothetical protein
MPTKSGIYAHCNPQLIKLFEAAGHPAKVACVALDFAKAQHTALICNGLGDLLQGAFAVDNAPTGAGQLLRQVRSTAKQRRIRPEHVFFGGEDYPSYAENFVRRLRQEKFLVVRVNAWEAKRQRSNFQASSDSLDLLGIARCCLNRRGETVRDLPVAYTNLRITTRDHDQLVRHRTAVSNRIHSYVDRLFPGFLNVQKGGLCPSCEANLDLMVDHFSLEQPDEVAAQLKQTGSPQKEPVVGLGQKRCNKRLKNVVLQAVEKVRQSGPEDLLQVAQQLETQDSHVEFALAKRLVRLGNT